jgi:hypothetical protein
MRLTPANKRGVPIAQHAVRLDVIQPGDDGILLRQLTVR